MVLGPSVHETLRPFLFLVSFVLQVLMQESGHEINPLSMLLAVSVPSTFLVAIVALATEWLKEDFNWADLPW